LNEHDAFILVPFRDKAEIALSLSAMHSASVL